MREYETLANHDLWEWWVECVALEQQEIVDLTREVLKWPMPFVRAWAAFKIAFMDGLRRDAAEEAAAEEVKRDGEPGSE